MPLLRDNIRFTQHAWNRMLDIGLSKGEVLDLLQSSTQFDERSANETKKLSKYAKTFNKQSHIYYYYNGRFQFTLEQNPDKHYDLIITVTDAVNYLYRKDKRSGHYKESTKRYKHRKQIQQMPRLRSHICDGEEDE